MAGIGQNIGQNIGGGGVPYLSGLLPLPSDFLPADLHVHFTIGVQGSLIDLTDTLILINSITIFDGTTGNFIPSFLGSSYVYSPSDNGYTFDIIIPIDQLTSVISVEIDTQTTDGTASVQTYDIVASPVYPPTPFGIPLGDISLERFSGEITGGLLGRPSGLTFISPALIVPQAGSELDIDFVENRALAAEPYDPPQTPNSRPFLVGPPPLIPPVPIPPWPPQFSVSYFPVLNDPNFALINTKPLVVGTMFDTISLVTSIILL